jgi:hypothetical protein
MRKMLTILALLLVIALCLLNFCVGKDGQTSAEPSLPGTNPTTESVSPQPSATESEPQGPDLGPGGLPIL